VKVQRGADDVLAGKYRLVRLIGAGGMGDVWEAVHTISGRPVAVKVLKSRPQGTERERFLQEARVAAALRHPNLVGVHEIVEDASGDLVMVMDLLLGEPLSAKIARQKKLALGEACLAMGSVVAAVAVAHAAGVVHRDLKPENIFLAGGSVSAVRVLDFGIAKVLDGASLDKIKSLTASGEVLGTPEYMSPEQVWGQRVDARSDVWSLGVVLYECLAGRRPIQAANVGELLAAVASQPIVPLAKIDPALPPSLTETVARMLDRDRATRLADLAAIGAELGRHASRASEAPSDAFARTSSGLTLPTTLIARR
jgi:serine/threonine-protein kinase